MTGFIRSVVDRATSALKGSFGNIKLNEVSFELHEGRAVVIKRRNLFGRHITGVANIFFRVVGAPVGFVPNLEAWRESEITCFQRLNPRFRAARVGSDAVCQDRLPGDSLWVHLQRKTLTNAMLAAAGRELRRAHTFKGDNGPWSHGDAAMRNFLYDQASDRTRLIDFELRHDRRLSPARRHAEDLLSFLLDLASLTPRRLWLRQARIFLHAYGPSDAITTLRERLQAPSGLARLWWNVRVNFACKGRIDRCLKQLRHSLEMASAPCHASRVKAAL